MKLTLILVIALMVIVGCSNKNDNNDNGNENNNSNEETKGGSNDEGDQVLQLGETGTMKDTMGEYEVTPTSFVEVDEWEGEVPRNEERIFLIIDVTIKNIGESVLDGEQLSIVDAIGGKDRVSSNNQLHDKTNQLEGELKPGEEMEGQFAFSVYPTDPYQLVLGMNLGSVSNKITWELHADDAS